MPAPEVSAPVPYCRDAPRTQLAAELQLDPVDVAVAEDGARLQQTAELFPRRRRGSAPHEPAQALHPGAARDDLGDGHRTPARPRAWRRSVSRYGSRPSFAFVQQ